MTESSAPPSSEAPTVPARELLVARQEATLIGTEVDPAGPEVADTEALASQQAMRHDQGVADDRDGPPFWRVLSLLGFGLAVGIGLLVAAARWPMTLSE